MRFAHRPRHATVVAYLALFIALGGSAYAAATISGSSIKKNSIPGNRLKKAGVAGDRLRNNTVTGRQVRESSLAQVPQAALAANANALGANPSSAFGAGLVNGSLYRVPNGTSRVQPYGYFAYASGDFFSVPAVAPVTFKVRDFVANVETLAGGTIDFSLSVTANSVVTTVPLCQVSGMVTSCRVDGPITIPRDASYRLEVVGNGLSGSPAVGFQYRATQD
jgi:hypothetical protein